MTNRGNKKWVIGYRRKLLPERSRSHSRASWELNRRRELCPRLSHSRDDKPMKSERTQSRPSKVSANPWILERPPRDSPTLLGLLSLHHSLGHTGKVKEGGFYSFLVITKTTLSYSRGSKIK